MDTVRLVLRFRDFDNEIGTIDAHNAVLSRRGSVLWGWWRKSHEPDRSLELTSLIDQLPIPVLIVNRETKRAYTTSCSAIYSRARGKREALVPPYYRDVASEIARWFEFREEIRETEYDGELARAMGEHTLVIEGVDEQDTLAPFVAVHTPSVGQPDEAPAKNQKHKPKEASKAKPRTAQGRARTSDVLRLVHVSDLHFGPEDHNFDFPGVVGLDRAQVTLAKAVERDYREHFGGRDADVLVVSGDVTSKAWWDPEFTDRVVEEIRDLANRLGVGTENILLAPGNHDFERPHFGKGAKASALNIRGAARFKHENDFRLFRNLLLNTPIVEPLSACYVWNLQDFDVFVGVLNSANLVGTDFVEYGFVGDHLDGVLEQMAGEARPAYRMLVLHHHLVPIASVEEAGDRAVSVTLDAHLILNKAQRNRVQLVLHGHQHIPKIVKTAQAMDETSGAGLEGEDVYIVASGSAGSRQLPHGLLNTYSVLELSQAGARVECRRLDRHGNPGARQFEVHLNIQPSLLN